MLPVSETGSLTVFLESKLTPSQYVASLWLERALRYPEDSYIEELKGVLGDSIAYRDNHILFTEVN